MTPDELRICNVVDTLIRKNRSFALWRIPGESPRFAMQTSGSARILYHIEELDEQSGFVIAPFHVSKQHPIVLIRPDIQKLPPDEEKQKFHTRCLRNREFHHSETLVSFPEKPEGRLQPSFQCLHRTATPKAVRETRAVALPDDSGRQSQLLPLPPLSSRQPDGTNIHMFISAILPRQAHGLDVRLKSSSPARKENGIRSLLPAPNLSKTGNYR